MSIFAGLRPPQSETHYTVFLKEFQKLFHRDDAGWPLNCAGHPAANASEII